MSDRIKIGREAHSLKGDAAALGLAQLAELAEMLEREAQHMGKAEYAAAARSDRAGLHDRAREIAAEATSRIGESARGLVREPVRDYAKSAQLTSSSPTPATVSAAPSVTRSWLSTACRASALAATVTSG